VFGGPTAEVRAYVASRQNSTPSAKVATIGRALLERGFRLALQGG